MPLGRSADWLVMSAAIAYIPAGFAFNLVLSSYARGMGSKIGYIAAIIGGEKVKIAIEEVLFKLDEKSLRCWKGWVNVAWIDSWMVMSLITFITVLMTSVMTYSLLAPRDLKLTGWAVALAQAKALADVLVQ